ncbi:unnamed protein product [Rhizophagus irregularis]|nr:unnamed protein product [Rhizophagus irregularis]
MDIEKFTRFSRRKLILIIVIGAILIQAVRNGYLLSNNFWQIKVTTALATVSIIRLIDIFNNKSPSLYSSIFNKVTALQQSSEGTSNEA